MPRRTIPEPQVLFEQTSQILNQFIDLRSVRSLAERLIEDAMKLVELVNLKVNHSLAFNLKSILKDIEDTAKLLPKAESQRYNFDLAMLGSIKREWFIDPSEALLTANIYPSYTENYWAYKIRELPVKHNPQNTRDFVSFIFFPKDESLESIELDDYAFLCHELSHDLLHHNKSAFTKDFLDKLEQVFYDENLSSISDNGALRSNTQQKLLELRKKWTPTDNTKSIKKRRIMR